VTDPHCPLGTTANTPFNYVQTGVLQPGVPFVTNYAQGVGTNGGGALQVVTPPGGVVTCSFVCLPWP
jgi:hypothetical protein